MRRHCTYLFIGAREVSLLIRRLGRGGQAGQGLAEYALILALVGVAAIVAITFMGGAINNLLSTLGNAL
jgi:Flp pilus assembly pilin Flp